MLYSLHIIYLCFNSIKILTAKRSPLEVYCIFLGMVPVLICLSTA